jgi:hypothetical protein
MTEKAEVDAGTGVPARVPAAQRRHGSPGPRLRQRIAAVRR